MTAHEEARATTSLVVYEPPAVLNVQQAERRYELPRTGAVFVRQAWGSGDTGAAQWPAGVELAKLIDSEGPERWRGKRVLEISAGGGAVVAIALMRAGATVVATDADAEALKLHEENARANIEPDVFASRYRGALVLRWGDDSSAAISALASGRRRRLGRRLPRHARRVARLRADPRRRRRRRAYHLWPREPLRGRRPAVLSRAPRGWRASGARRRQGVRGGRGAVRACC